MAAAAFPAFHVTGAIHHYIAAYGSTTPLYLGTCESHPSVSFQETFTDVRNDMTGPSLPAQRIENGEVGNLAIGLNRFSKATWLGFLASNAPGNRGRWSRSNLVFGGIAVQLWMVFENFLDNTVKAQFPSMEIGWYWPQVHITGKEYPRLGNGQDTLLVIHGEAHPQFTGNAINAQATGVADPTAVAAGERQFFMYSSDSTGTYTFGAGVGYFPAAVRVPQ